MFTTAAAASTTATAATTTTYYYHYYCYYLLLPIRPLCPTQRTTRVTPGHSSSPPPFPPSLPLSHYRQPTIYRCQRCRVNFYCSREHQRQDWERHRGDCVKGKGEPPPPLAPLITRPKLPLPPPARSKVHRKENVTKTMHRHPTTAVALLISALVNI